MFLVTHLMGEAGEAGEASGPCPLVLDHPFGVKSDSKRSPRKKLDKQLFESPLGSP